MHLHKNQIHTFLDADWARNHHDWTSTFTYLVYLGSNLIFWSSKMQNTVTQSSTEAEYYSVITTTTERLWVLSLLKEPGVPSSATTIYFDNMGATYLCANLIFHLSVKHNTIDFHFVKDKVTSSISHGTCGRTIDKSLIQDHLAFSTQETKGLGFERRGSLSFSLQVAFQGFQKNWQLYTRAFRKTDSCILGFSFPFYLSLSIKTIF